MRSVVLIFCSILLSTSLAHAGGRVADELRFKIDEGYIEVSAGNMRWKPIPLQKNATIEVLVDVHNQRYDDLSVLICDAQQLSVFRSGNSARCYGGTRLKDRFQISGAIDETRQYYLVFSNTFSLIVTKKASFTVYATTPTPWELAHKLEEGFSALTAELSRTYGINEFDILVESCGHENAYSAHKSGNITLCSELLMELIKTNNEGALFAVLLHEVGHSLLNKLGLPNWDNEETVDEFAIYMLYLASKQEAALSWIEWNEQKNSRAEMINALENDVRHPLSIQRARNVRRLLNNPSEMITRWNNFLYPHMTSSALQKIASTSPPRSDPEKANSILAARN